MDFVNSKSLGIILKTLSRINKFHSGRGNSPAQTNLNIKKPLNTIKQTQAKINTQNEMKARMLNRAEQSAFMKELLNLPKDIKELLGQLAQKSTSQQAMAQLLRSGTVKINPEIIQQLLEANSKEVISKLIRLIQQSPNNTQGYDQIKPLLALLGQIAPARDSSPQETLTQLLLLYLPWLPLMEEQRVQVRFEKKKKSSGSDDEKIAMVIYISTINLGRFKVTIFTDKKNDLDIHIEHISEDREELSEKEAQARKEVLEAILKNFNSEMKEEKIQAKTCVSQVKQKNFEESATRDVTISNINSISPVILLAAQKVAMVILEIDEKICLLEKRRQDVSGSN